MSTAVTREKHRPTFRRAVAVLTFVAIFSSGFSGIASGAPQQVIKPPVISEGKVTKLPCTKQDQSTIGMMGCIEKHLGEVDRRINAEVALIFRFLDTAEKRSLVTAEAAWLHYRKVDCLSVASLFQGGTIAPIEYGSCEVKDDQEYSGHLYGFFTLLTQGRGSVPRWP